MNDPRMEKLQQVMQNKQYAEELMALETTEEIQAKFAEAGIEFSADEVEKIVEFVVSQADKSGDELGEDSLENVTGGVFPIGMAIFLGLTILGVAIGWKAAGGCNNKKKK